MGLWDTPYVDVQFGRAGDTVISGGSGAVGEEWGWGGETGLPHGYRYMDRKESLTLPRPASRRIRRGVWRWRIHRRPNKKQKQTMKTQIEIEVGSESLMVRGPYSDSNNSKYRTLGGKFTDGRWQLPDNETTREKLAELFGSKSELVEVKVPVNHASVFGYGTLQIGGYVLATRRYRDGRVEMPHGVSVASGGFPSSGGSQKSPRVCPDDETVLRLTCRESFANSHGLERFTQGATTVEV